MPCRRDWAACERWNGRTAEDKPLWALSADQAAPARAGPECPHCQRIQPRTQAGLPQNQGKQARGHAFSLVHVAQSSTRQSWCPLDVPDEYICTVLVPFNLPGYAGVCALGLLQVALIQ